MVEDAQTHLLPADPAALDNVAHLDGLADGGALLKRLEPHVEQAGQIFDSLSPGERGQLSSDPDILQRELKQLGFPDPAAAARHVGDWRSGKARSLRSPPAQQAFEAMLPGLMQAIAAAADPEHALNRLSDIVERLSSGVNFFRLLEARPALARLLAKVLVHAPALSEQLARRPELFEGLFDDSSFAMPPPAEEFAELLGQAMRGQPYDVAFDRVRRSVNERRFALGVQLIDRHRDPLEVTEGYARVAEGALVALGEVVGDEFEKAHGVFAQSELIVLGLGRLGGHSLTHVSDLDLIYLHTAGKGGSSDGAKPLGPNDYFNRLASRMTAALSVATAAGPLYQVDTRLRPEGAKGMLVVSLEAFERYQRHEAWTWEHMALCRARPVFGSPEARAEAAATIGNILRMPRDFAKTAGERGQDARRHGTPQAAPQRTRRQAWPRRPGRPRICRARAPAHAARRPRHPARSRAGSARAESLVPANIVDALKLLSRMLVMMRLVAPGNVKPARETWELVALACGAASWEDLLAEHDAARHSIAELWNSIKREA